METIYATTPPEDIPWNRDTIPELLRRLVENGTVLPCRALDIGCGTGNYAIRLASLGFEVTGIDVSPSAIRMARERMMDEAETRTWGGNESKGTCGFEVTDILDAPERLRELLGTFEFSYDYEVLHHIFPDERERYARNVSSLLEPGGRHLSVCFSEQDDQFPGEGKVRTTRLGTRLYLSSEEEIGELFGRQFRVIDLGTITVPGNRGSHQAVYCFMEK